jgi:hypothetical protein
MFLLAKYGVQTTFTFPIVKRGVVDLAASADWTPATGDTKISKDGGSVANSTNNPVAVGGTGSVLWSLTLTATELTATTVDIQIVDSATKAIEDQVIKVYTYGNTSAKIPFDFSINQTGDSFSRLGAPTGASVSGDIATIDDFLDTEITAIKAKTDLLPEGIKKNQALNDFQFAMMDSTTGQAKIGLVNAGFTKKETIDSATPVSLSGTVTEVNSTDVPGIYSIDLTAGELNGDIITLRFAASGCYDTVLTIKTNP